MMNVNPESGLEYARRRREKIEGMSQATGLQKMIGWGVFLLILLGVVAFVLLYR